MNPDDRLEQAIKIGRPVPGNAAQATELCPPVVMGNKGYETDARGKSFTLPLNAEQRANLERVRSDVVAMADDFCPNARREMIEALGGEWRPKCKCGWNLYTMEEQRDGICAPCARAENSAWAQAQRDHPNNGG